ncbi:MAG TPA: hypothetical protein VGE27_13905 [Gemmatimonas sp.]|uniref:LVIVD repeat-containing protein n=1 Tax=Gemmatimonas sp. TaxID=1962908 RepID=UPI002EDA0C60
MPMRPLPARSAIAAMLLTTTLLVGCGSDPVAAPDLATGTGGSLTHVATGTVSDRFTAEVWVRGNTAYTTTWGIRSTARGNAVKIWDVSASQPRLVDSVIVENASTTGDVQVSDDGAIMLVAIENNPNGGVAIYSMADARKPQLLIRTTGGELQTGVHTAELARVNGVLYAFCVANPASNVASRLVILDLSNPASPRTVFSQAMGRPNLHDVFVRDGLLFTAEWNDGMGIWDIGGAGNGSVSQPRRISQIATVGGQVHNMWWMHDPVTSSKRYVLVGQEGPGSVGSSSSGDIHVVDISSLTAPAEVAVYSVPGAGTHNFSVDEANGIAYAAYYNAGVQVLDVRGDMGSCGAGQRTADGRCDLLKMGRYKGQYTGGISGPVYVWGVHWTPTAVFASDMLHGLFRATPARR